jgi:hypothetical protein
VKTVGFGRKTPGGTIRAAAGDLASAGVRR